MTFITLDEAKEYLRVDMDDKQRRHCQHAQHHDKCHASVSSVLHCFWVVLTECYLGGAYRCRSVHGSCCP